MTTENLEPQKPKKQVTPTNLEPYKKEMLNQLKESGTKGFTKSRLIGKSRPKTKALKELEESGEIINLGSKGRTRYVLKEFDMPLEIGYELLVRKAATGRPTLFSRTKLRELVKGAPAKVMKRMDEAIDRLVREKKLIRLISGKTAFFLHAASIQSFIASGLIEPEEKEAVPESKAGEPVSQPVPPEPKPEPAPGLTREQVTGAYRRVMNRVGSPNIAIYEIQRELGVSMEMMKAFVLKENQNGNAVLSPGDWPSASEAVRSGSVYIEGRPHLLVRFKE